jgi:ABC-type glycerol-3-phosphate transport system substrate-binding protein
MKKTVAAALVVALGLIGIAGGAARATAQTSSLTIYSGRDEALVKPIIDRFTATTGIELKVRYASSASLATALVEEGGNSPADVFWATEPGTLGLVAARGLLLDAEPALGRDERALAGTRLQHPRTDGSAAAEVDLGAHGLAVEGEDRHGADECVVPGLPRRDHPSPR